MKFFFIVKKILNYQRKLNFWEILENLEFRKEYDNKIAFSVIL